MAEKRTTYKVRDLEDYGQVYIADEVITAVAALAATEVDGVASLAGNITYDLVGKVGSKNLSKGVKISLDDMTVDIDLGLNIEYGKNIIETGHQVQEKVKSSVENMTGFGVRDVNIHIAGVDIDARNAEKYTNNT